MKVKTFIILIIATLLTASCDKLPANGDLDGMWQLLTIERNGDIENVKDKQYYMSIQLKLFQLGHINNPYCFFGYFEHKGDIISFWQFSNPCMNETPEDDNIPLTDSEVSKLHPWGFYTLKERMKVITLTDERMVLQSDSATITYRKF